MIAPAKEIVKYDRPRNKLEEWLVFSVLVANKPAERTAKVTRAFLASLPGRTPFAKIRAASGWELRSALIAARTGQYRRISRALRKVVKLDPQWASLKTLELAVGPKTARFYLLSTRPDARCAALDTHILKFLRLQGHVAPANTPPAGPQYERLENLFLKEADRRRMTPAKLDEAVWRSYAVHKRPYQ